MFEAGCLLFVRNLSPKHPSPTYNIFFTCKHTNYDLYIKTIYNMYVCERGKGRGQGQVLVIIHGAGPSSP